MPFRNPTFENALKQNPDWYSADPEEALHEYYRVSKEDDPENTPDFQQFAEDVDYTGHLLKREYDRNLAEKMENLRGRSDFGRAGEIVLRQYPQLAYGVTAFAGAVGEELFGSGGVWEDIKNFGVEGYEDWSKSIEAVSLPTDSFNYAWNEAKNGNKKALLDLFEYGLGYTGIQMLSLIGGVGLAKKGVELGTKALLKNSMKKMVSEMVEKEAKSIAAKGVGKLSAKQIEKAAVQRTARKIAEKAASAAALTEKAGIGAFAFGMEGGEIGGSTVSRAVQSGEDLTGTVDRS